MKVGHRPTFIPPKNFYVGTHIQEQGKRNCHEPWDELQLAAFLRI